MSYIWTKFYTGTKNHTPQAILPSKFHSHKIQGGGGRHFEIFLMATTWLLLNIFAQNLAQSLETTSRKQFYLQILLLIKLNMAAAAILKFTLTAIPVIIAYIRTKFGTASKSDVSVTEGRPRSVYNISATKRYEPLRFLLRFIAGRKSTLALLYVNKNCEQCHAHRQELISVYTFPL